MPVTKKFAVFGNPIAQSKSPLIHTMFAKQCDIDMTYSTVLGTVDNIGQEFDSFFSDPHALGVNVTMPFKEDAANWVTELSDNAKAANAVNTIIRKGNSFIGDSTDGVGLVSDLCRLGMFLRAKKVLLIGAGGAARGAFANILAEGPASIDILNRSLDNARRLASVVNNNITNCISDASELGQYDVIINATSLSLSDQLPNITDKQLLPSTCVYDMVYKTQDTVFINWAKQQGLTHAADGLGMLVGQAAQSFYLWTGLHPDVEPVLKTLRSQM